MNLKRLISSVYDRQCIWNQQDSNYNNKAVLKQMWYDIALEMDSTAEVCRQKWRSLRDVFRRELRKYQTRLENPDIQDKAQPRWYYFKDLQFLTDQMLGFDNFIRDLPTERSDEPFESFYVMNSLSPTAIKSEPDSIEHEEIILENSEDKNIFVEIEDENNDQDDHKKIMSIAERLSVRRPVVGQPSLITLQDGRKRQKLCDKGKEDDSDYHFLMSLLPYLRDIPHERKLLVRTKILNVLCEEANEK